jgi:hypothetical protein
VGKAFVGTNMEFILGRRVSRWERRKKDTYVEMKKAVSEESEIERKGDRFYEVSGLTAALMRIQFF